MFLKSVAKKLVVPGKGILAADESFGTIEKRFKQIKLKGTKNSRRSYRELLFTAPGIEKYISGVILFDETIHQSAKSGMPFPKFLKSRGIIAGIKVDQGVEVMSSSKDEVVTNGLDGLGNRLKDYKKLGARFAKWRAVIKIGKNLPTKEAIKQNAEGLAEYAKVCQKNGIVPIVEPEVLMEGSHSIEKCYEVTEDVLKAVFAELKNKKVNFKKMLLKPNMVIPGSKGKKVDTKKIAEMTLQCFWGAVPKKVPGIVFLSGGQSEVEACTNLNAMNALKAKKPWVLSFSFGRALQASTIKVWGGKKENVKKAQKVFLKRCKLASLASLGKYSSKMEK